MYGVDPGLEVIGTSMPGARVALGNIAIEDLRSLSSFRNKYYHIEDFHNIYSTRVTTSRSPRCSPHRPGG